MDLRRRPQIGTGSSVNEFIHIMCIYWYRFFFLTAVKFSLWRISADPTLLQTLLHTTKWMTVRNLPCGNVLNCNILKKILNLWCNLIYCFIYSNLVHSACFMGTGTDKYACVSIAYWDRQVCMCLNSVRFSDWISIFRQSIPDAIIEWWDLNSISIDSRLFKSLRLSVKTVNTHGMTYSIPALDLV